MAGTTGGKTPLDMVFKKCSAEAERLRSTSNAQDNVTAIIHDLLGRTAGKVISTLERFSTLAPMVNDSENNLSLIFSNWGAHGLHALLQGTGLITLQTPQGDLAPSVSYPTLLHAARGPA